MVGIAGIASSFAQNVYSVNVVGYVNLTLTSEYSLVANQLDNGNGNLAVEVIPTAPIGTVIYKFNPATSTYATLTRIPTGWLPATSTMTIAPGEGVFIKKPASASQIDLTFVGEVMQDTLVNPVVIGFDIYSAMVPQAGGLVTVHEYPGTAGDIVYRFNSATGLYQNFTRLPTGSWIPSEPSVEVGEAFFLKSNVAKDWTRVFTVQ